MNKRILIWISVALVALPASSQRQWTLRECIDYALEHNIQLQQNRLQQESSGEDVKQARAQLLPSATFSTAHNVNYRPFPDGGETTVTNGYVDTKINKTTYNGSYNIGANWTVWNGNKNVNTLKQNKITEEQAELTAETTANSIQEQITQLYVQILYNTESIKVFEQIVAISKGNLERGRAMLEVGSIARADVAKLEAQVATDEYNLVNAQGQTARYKLQLKQLLEITDTEDFDIAIPDASDEEALAEVPSLVDTYNTAVSFRPEIKSAQLGIEASELEEKIARAGYMPTIGVNASVTASTNSTSDNSWGKQMKSNFSAGAGVSLSVPLYEQRSAKTSIRKAKLQRQEQELDLQTQQKELWSTIEGYWLDANTNQARFRSAQASVNSAQESFDLVSEKFNEGLSNIEELTTGKSTLLDAEQSRLESKYTSILNLQMLHFYNGEEINL
ncbi:MAG: TolC family protein [Prevotella sp.]|nr:TolC family protein [Prevotella sp.]